MNLPTLTTILEFLTPHRLFEKLRIVSKMLLGYMSLVIFTVVVVAYALLSLQRMNSLNSELVKIDIPIQETADKMTETLLAQDTYEKRFLILKGNDMRNLFRKRSNEFITLIEVLWNLPGSRFLPKVSQIAKYHSQYVSLFEREMKLIKAGDTAGATNISKRQLKIKLDQLLEALRTISVEAKISQDMKMKKIQEIGSKAFITTSILCVLSIMLGALSSMIVTHHISSSVNKLMEATTQISEGNFQYAPKITAQDEIGSLAQAFVTMGKRLGKLEEMYLDASPLTRLPGGIAIENVLKRRIASGQPIAFCMIDVDNFKSFNDHYGYAHGNEVIKETAKIIENAVRNKGSQDDFMGHIGGDDFVVITRPATMRSMCSEIIRLFDERVPQFYDQDDRNNGFILGKSRQEIEMKFPLMTLSIAVVTNEYRTIASAIEASELAAELKDYAKTIPSSVYVVDKRRSS
ncbi:MAG TPA: diguanylate cyclase [Candidatus Hodarchaeales archaeon]|nr:diguanylate cyclase [Candidatus Hodarchaeales archaeon]